MLIAIVSDIHGNLPALEAVLADLEDVRPGLVVLGGDLAAVAIDHPNAATYAGWLRSGIFPTQPRSNDHSES